MKPHFSIFGVPVRLDPSFLILIGIFGYFAFLRTGDPNGVEKFLLAFPLVLGAVLLHELGHALAGRAFGLKPFVILHAFGGVTQFPPGPLRALSHGRRVLITLAGPGVGVVLGVVAVAVVLFGGLAPQSLEREMAEIAVFVTLGWSLLNLAPILPLDGGHVVATALERWLGPTGLRIARVSSIVLALGVGATLLVVRGELFWGLVGGLLAWVNYRAYRLERFLHQEAPLQKELARATEALARGDAATARALAEPLRERAKSPEARTRVLHVLAWARLSEGDAEAARRELDALPPSVRPDAYLDGRVRLSQGDASGALGPLVEALEDRREEEVAETVAAAVAEAGRLDELAALLDSEGRSRTAGAAALQRVAYTLFERGEHALAGRLYERIFARFGDPLDAFNAACARVRTGDEDGAVAWLERAVDAGLEETRLLDTDEDLAPLRGHPGLDALRARARGGA